MIKIKFIIIFVVFLFSIFINGCSYKKDINDNSSSNIEKEIITGKDNSSSNIEKEIITGKDNSSSNIEKEIITGKDNSPSNIEKENITGKDNSPSNIEKENNRLVNTMENIREYVNNIDNTEKKLKIKNSYKKLNKRLNNVKNMSIRKLSNYNCLEYFPKSGAFMKQWEYPEEKQMLKKFRNKCYKLVKNAKQKIKPQIKKFKEKIRNFNIKDCRKIIINRYGDSLDKKYLENEINRCKYGYAISKNNCNLFNNNNKIKKCKNIKEQVKDFKDMREKFNKYGNFNIKEYIKK